MKTIDAGLFWDRIDELRNLLELTLMQVCENEPRLVYRTLTQQRTRNILPNVETLALLAKALDTSIDYLVSGEENADTITKFLRANKPIRDLAYRLTLCDAEQLHCVNSLLDTWRIDRVPGESKKQGVILA